MNMQPPCPFTGIEFPNPEAVPLDQWRWPNFTPYELRSKGDGKVMIDPASMDKLQALRDRVGKPLHLTSAYRSDAHNRRVGGKPHSEHLKARAYDIRIDGHHPAALERDARAVGFTGFGFYPKNGFLHIDTGRPRIWGERWPAC